MSRLGRILLLAVLAMTCAMPLRAEQVLRVGITALPPSLFNPYANTGLPYVYVWSAVFDGLTFIDETGTVRPWLATSWRNVDALTWHFDLRQGVVFSDGTPFTAEAVVAVNELLTGPAAVREVVARMMSFLDSARVIDDHTVEIKTKVPTPLLPRYLPQFHIISPTQIRKLGLEGFAKAPVATGPFKVDRIGPNTIGLSAHRHSWRKPALDGLEFVVNAEASARKLAVLSNRLDIAMNLGPEETASIVEAGGHEVSWRDAAVWAYHFIGLTENPTALAPFRDIRVREALNLAVDREAIIDALLMGQSVPATQPAPAEAYGFDPALPPIPHDPDKARRLLAEAGYAKGFKFTMEATVGSSPNDAALHQIVAQNLAAVGVTMEIRPISTNQLIRNVVEGGWTGDAFGLFYNLEPTADVLRPLDTHSCRWHHAWYCNPATTPLIEAAHQEFDEAKGLKLRQEIMAAYRNDWAAIFIHQAVRFAGLAPKVSGLKVVNNVILFDQIRMQ
ncbi:MAG: ABC transporter substrate-binding protein [Rhodospirillaceae bacterium]|nr:ABC transporter substrate-binding protein [Rhodospirillaceae bacterium]